MENNEGESWNGEIIIFDDERCGRLFVQLNVLGSKFEYLRLKYGGDEPFKIFSS